MWHSHDGVESCRYLSIFFCMLIHSYISYCRAVHESIPLTAPLSSDQLTTVLRCFPEAKKATGRVTVVEAALEVFTKPMRLRSSGTSYCSASPMVSHEWLLNAHYSRLVKRWLFPCASQCVQRTTILGSQSEEFNRGHPVTTSMDHSFLQ